jgi:hypothetical protein
VPRFATDASFLVNAATTGTTLSPIQLLSFEAFHLLKRSTTFKSTACFAFSFKLV